MNKASRMTRAQTTILQTLLIAIVTLTSGCSRFEQHLESQTPLPASTPAPTPGKFTSADLKKLRWIEGSWLGTGYDKPFFERYRFENDSTLLVDTFSDETLSKIEDTTRFELKDGQFASAGDSGYVAAMLDDNSIFFIPVAKAKNSFRWQRESDTVWKATLWWPGSEKGPAKERVYRMERIAGK